MNSLLDFITSTFKGKEHLTELNKDFIAAISAQNDFYKTLQRLDLI